MNRKLLLLNAVLVGVLAYAGFQFRDLWRSAQARERRGLNVKVPAVPPPQIAPPPEPQAVRAASYLQIPQKFLLDPSRNADVAPEPEKPPPPPPPMPPLPVYHGQMNLGDGQGLFAILSLNNAAPHQAIHMGESIGQFKLLSVNRETIDFEWDGQTVHRMLYELVDHSAVQQQQAEAVVQRAAAAPPPPPVEQKPLGPGPVSNNGAASCLPNDSSPEGTIVNGLRKVNKPSPFGPMCFWEPIAGGGR